MYKPEPVEAPIIDVAEIVFDINAFDDFMQAMQAEIDQNLQPYSDMITTGMEGTTATAIAQNTVSVPLYEFRHEYYVAVDAAVAGLRSYVEATKVLVRSLELMSKFYRGADGMAVASLADANGALAEAQKQITAETPPVITQTPI